MLNSKQRSFLRSLAHHLEPAVLIGKNGVTPNLVHQTDEYLEIHELAKCSVQQNLDADIKVIAHQLALDTKSDVVQVIGRKFVLFKRNHKEPKIELPR